MMLQLECWLTRRVLAVLATGGCPYGAAWFDFASATDTAHSSLECSNMVQLAGLSVLSVLCAASDTTLLARNRASVTAVLASATVTLPSLATPVTAVRRVFLFCCCCCCCYLVPLYSSVIWSWCCNAWLMVLCCCSVACRNFCNGHGVCYNLDQAARYQDDISLFTTTTYTLWDAKKICGCVCEEGWTGFDCSQR